MRAFLHGPVERKPFVFETWIINRLQWSLSGNLGYLSEVFSIEDDGSHKFSRSAFAITTHDDYVWFGQALVRKKDLSSKDIMESLKFVPDEDIYPEPPAHITTVSVPIDGSVFIKGPKAGSYDAFEGTDSLPKLLLQEAEILELLRRNQHPNIVRYHGSICQKRSDYRPRSRSTPSYATKSTKRRIGKF